MRSLFLFLIFFLPFAMPAAASMVPESEKPAAAPVTVAPKPQKVVLPDRRPMRAAGENDALPQTDVDESVLLPKYPAGARVALGKSQDYTVGEEDTMLDIARHFRLGFIELRAANPGLDPWTPVPGESVFIPGFHLLPRAPQKGIVVNLAQMRLYYFPGGGAAPETFPIGVGREGLQTPTGETTIVRKVANPLWFPTERMREEKPFLPVVVKAGPSNPLGTHALYLGWPTFLIHGSNKPWAIGRRVSSGCMRMYPEGIRELYEMVPVGTPVTIVDQPILVGWVGDALYLEANPSRTQGNDIEIEGEYTIKRLNEALKKVIIDAAAEHTDLIDWDMVAQVVEERRGYPVMIASTKNDPPPQKRPSAAAEPKYVYN